MIRETSPVVSSVYLFVVWKQYHMLGDLSLDIQDDSEGDTAQSAMAMPDEASVQHPPSPIKSSTSDTRIGPDDKLSSALYRQLNYWHIPLTGD